MGASDSKLTFKQGIFRLSEPEQIPADDEYWTGFWELPESTEDVFSLFSPADIRRTRDNNLANLESPSPRASWSCATTPPSPTLILRPSEMP
jgi:hypothetical protein